MKKKSSLTPGKPVRATKKASETSPKWTKPFTPKPKRLVGLNLDDLKGENLKKFINLMEEIEYEPFHIFNQNATRD